MKAETSAELLGAGQGQQVHHALQQLYCIIVCIVFCLLAQTQVDLCFGINQKLL